MQARFWLAPVALLLSNLPQFALAQENPRIYLAPGQVVGEENRPAEGLDSALLSAVGDKPIVILTPNKSSSGDLSSVAAKIKEGQKLVDSAPDKAIDILKGALDTYEASLSQIDDFEPYLQALSLLATAYFNGGYEDEYSAAVKKFSALRLDGVPKGTNEEVADEISKAQAKAKKAAPGTVKISANEEGFQVRVDGADMAGAKSMQLPPGTHFIVVTAPGKNPYSEKINVASSGTVQVSATLSANADASTASPIERATAPTKELVDFLKKGSVTSETRKYAVDLAKKNKADFIVLNIVARDSGQYRAYIYALRISDGSLVAIAEPSYTPGPAATLATPANDIMNQLVGVAYNFPKAKAIPASPAITIVAKGAVPIVVNTPDTEDPDANPTKTTPKVGPATKVDPYAVGIAALPTDGSDTILTAPPDAQGGGVGNVVVVNNPKVVNSPKETNTKVVTPTKVDPPANNYNNGNNTRGNPALNVEPPEPRPQRDPINWSEIQGKSWFWPVVGAVGVSALGTGVFLIARPNGLDATVTWP